MSNKNKKQNENEIIDVNANNQVNPNITNNIESYDLKEINAKLDGINDIYDNFMNEIAAAENTTKEEFDTKLRSDILSDNNIIKSNAIKVMSNVLENLQVMVLKQSLSDDWTGEYTANFNNKFIREELNEGNSIQHIISLSTGHSQFNKDKWIPNSFSNPKQEATIFSFLDPTNPENLSPNAFKFKKDFSARPEQWIPFFMSGKLGQFVAQNVSKMLKTFNIYMYDKNLKLLTADSTYSKKITGKATNMFDCFADEIIPEIIKFKLPSSLYNSDATSKAIRDTSTEDITVLVNSSTLSKLKSGIKSLLPSSNLLDFESQVGDAFVPGFKYVIPGDNGENTLITVEATEYVLPTEMYVFDNKILANHFMIRQTGKQYYLENMTDQNTIHIWGLTGILKWGKGFKYTNPNLPLIPTKEAV